jgi:hypothetical protein
MRSSRMPVGGVGVETGDAGDLMAEALLGRIGLLVDICRGLPRLRWQGRAPGSLGGWHADPAGECGQSG